MSQATLDDMMIRFPLPPGQEAYADIEGKRMHRDVIEQANNARRSCERYELVLPVPARCGHQ
jgi:hypothetical protein